MDVRRILIGARGRLGRDLVRRYRAAGIETVAAFAAADGATPYVEEADYPAFLGDGDAWGVPARLVELAMDAGCDAIHPGRGAASVALALYTAASAANVLIIGLPPRRAAEALDVVRMMGRARAAGLHVPPAEALDPAMDAIEAAARVGVPLWVLPTQGGRARRVEAFETLGSALADRTDGGVVLVHEVPGHQTLDVVLIGDRDGVIPLGVVATCGPVAVYPADDGGHLVEPAVHIAREIGLTGVATVRFRVAADGSAWWWGLRPHLPPAAGLVEAIQGIDLVQAELAAASGQRLGWAARDAAGTRGHGVSAVVSRTGPGEVARLEIPGGEGIRSSVAVDSGSVLPDGADTVLLELIAVADPPASARERLLDALVDTHIDGLPTDLGPVLDAVRGPKPCGPPPQR